MNQDQDAILDDLLSRWHHFCSKAQHVRGYAPKALVCGDFRVSRQYDDTNGALDSDLEADVMRAVDFQVSEMADPWRSAIFANARNLCTGLVVWGSPRLPADPLQRAALIVEARIRLVRRLFSAGVM